MIKKIGEVSIDYTFYRGKDLYSDGSIEDDLLKACQSRDEDHLLHTSNNWAVLYHLSDIRENLLEWYPFSKDDDVLEIGSGCGAITGVLSRKVKSVTCIELSEKRSLINAYRNRECRNVTIKVGNFKDVEPHVEMFDYITLIGVWEYSGSYIEAEDPYIEMLAIIKRHLKPNGKIIIAIENKMGLKYWNGAAEDHTGELYSGLNDYTDVDNRKIRTFSKTEIEKLLKTVGIDQFAFYYPMPDYKLPDKIYTEFLMPDPGKERNFGKDYNRARIYNFNDAIISDQLACDGMFDYFANSFLVIAGEQDVKLDFAKYNRCRHKEFRIKTEIYVKDGQKYVRNIALHESAQKHILKMKSNEDAWKGVLPSLKYVEGWIENNEYTTPYIDGTDLDVLFYEFRNDHIKFIDKFIFYLETFMHPDDSSCKPFQLTEEYISVYGEVYPQNAKTLETTNVDLTFSNLKLTSDGQLYNFDYEWIFSFPIPYEYVLWRSAYQLYNQYRAYLKPVISKEQFLEEVGITKRNIVVYNEMERNFFTYVFGKNCKENYLLNYKKSRMIQNIKFF